MVKTGTNAIKQAVMLGNVAEARTRSKGKGLQ